MNTSNVKTSRDLADLLESVAKMLRALPDYELSEAYVQDYQLGIQQKSVGTSRTSKAQISLADFACELPNLSRESAESELKSLTLDSMRQVAALLEIRIPSKATKSETLSTLLAQVFDIPAGQERIRTFHKRKLEA